MSDQDRGQEIVLVPVDENGRVLLFSDLKIENVDRDYRTIRDPEGLSWQLQPGNYTVKVFLRDLQMKSVPFTVTPEVSRYKLSVPTKPAPQTDFEIAEVPVPPPPAPPRPEQKTSPRAKSLSDSDVRKRFPISFPVSYRVDSGKWVQAKALNISASGVCVENLAHVTEDDNLYVRLHVPIATIPIECPARVVWVMSKDSQTPCMGLQLFLTANMRDSLDKWLSGI